MSIRTILAGAAGAAVLSLGLTTAPALADDLPQAGDECAPPDSRESIELPDGSVLECQRPADGGRDWAWVIVVEPTGEPTDEPTQGPTEKPTDPPTGEPTPDPTGDPTDDPTGEPTGEPTEEPGDPAPDEWAEFVGMLEPAPEGLRPGRFCGSDEALLVYGYGDNAIQCQYNQDSDRYHWVEVKGFEDLVVEDEDPGETDPGEGEDGDDKPAPPADKGEEPATGEASDRSLPVTGGALAGLVLAAVTAAGAGGATMWLARNRKGSAEDSDEDATA